MTLFDTGRVCVKTAGREAGRVCVVLDKVDSDHVLVTGPRSLTGVRKRKCNVAHLEPLPAKLKIKAEAGDPDIIDLLKKEGELLEKFKLNVPSAEETKKLEDRKMEKAARKAEQAKPVTVSDLAAEKTKIKEKAKDAKATTLSDLAAETRKLEAEAEKSKKEAKPKEARKKEEKK